MKKQPIIYVRIFIEKMPAIHTEYFSVQATIEEMIEFCKLLIDAQCFSQFLGGRSTYIEVREKTNGKFGRSKTIHFRGMNPTQTKKLIFKTLKK